jgi:hypothetical protein
MAQYGLAALDADGQPDRYVMDFIDSAFGGAGYRWTTDVAMAWKRADRATAQAQADESNQVPGNAHVDVVELPAEG